MKKALFTLLLFCLGFFISACGDSSGGGSAPNFIYFPIVTDTENANNTNNSSQHPLKTITLSKDAFTIDIGKTDNITVYVDGQDKTQEATFTF